MLHAAIAAFPLGGSGLGTPLTAVPALIDALRTKRCYAHAVAQIEIVETHASWVLLTGEHAYKIKKPVNLGFLDYSTLAKRRQACDQELRLNRAWAPELYLDVVPITGPVSAPQVGGTGTPIEYAVHMRQFNRAQQLDHLLAAGRLAESDMDGIADYIANAHANAARLDSQSAWGRAGGLRRAMLDNFTALEDLLPAGPHSELAGLRAWTEAEFGRRRALMEARRQQGWVRECHGDLHLANLTRYGGRLLAFDCIEFDPALRWLDVLNDAAFLVMDLLARGRRDFAWRFLNGYLQHSGDYRGLPLLRYFLVYRALVRAKVAQLTPGGAAPAGMPQPTARPYLELAEELISEPAPRLVLMHGLSGSGKTWLSERLMTRLPAIRLRSDVERKRLHGLQPQARSGSAPGAHLYDEHTTLQTYRELLALAEVALASGCHVIVDAVFLLRWQRRLFRELAARLRIPWVIVECRAPVMLLRARLEERSAAGHDASEATLAVLDYQLRALQALERSERTHAVAVDGRKLPDLTALTAVVLRDPQEVL